MDRNLVTKWQELSALYDQAEAMSERARATWLSSLRDQAHPLWSTLSEMFLARSQAERNGFLDSLPRVDPGPALAREPIRVGPYQLISHLGTGGMSEVWLARRDDGAFERQVAIKLLYCHAGVAVRDSFTQRFARERDILASLHHPHIACLHDAGVTPAGQPWLALEYVEGQTLTRWCDAQRLTVAARIRLFQQVLQAVQHAHANLVIHRDLKPGNIFVTRHGEVRLLDFGIAKIMLPDGPGLLDSELTRQAGRPLTLQYASPEQVLGNPLSTACDVYSLGVVLYELLCGDFPYDVDSGSAAQMEHAVLHREPRPPGRRVIVESIAQARGTLPAALRKVLASDLGAVVLKALAKRPEERYRSVEAFSADLDRWIDGKPVLARPPSTLYRVTKFVRRHRLPVAAGVAALLSLASVAVIAILLGLQARQEAARAVAAREFMLRTFQRANQERARGADITARQLLETGRRDVLTQLTTQPNLQAELLRGISKIQMEMGDYNGADITLAELVQVSATKLHDPRDEAMARADHANNALQMNNAELARRRLTAATEVIGRPRNDPELNARLAEVKGRIALSDGDPLQASSIFHQARSDAIRDFGLNDLRTLRLGQALARSESDLGNFDEALQMQRMLRVNARDILGARSAELVAMDWEQAKMLTGAGRFAESMELLNSALPNCIEALGVLDDGCQHLTLKLAQTLMRIGKIGDLHSILPTIRKIESNSNSRFLQIEAEIIEFKILSLENNLTEDSIIFRNIKDFGESGEVVQMPKSFKAGALVAIAESYLRLRQYDKVLDWINKSNRLLDSDIEQPDNLRVVAVAQMLAGIAFLGKGDLDEALKKLEKSRNILDRTLGVNHPTNQLYRLNSALAFIIANENNDAIAIVQRAIPILQKSLGSASPTYKRIDRLRVNLLTRINSPISPSIRIEGASLCPRSGVCWLEFFS